MKHLLCAEHVKNSGQNKQMGSINVLAVDALINQETLIDMNKMQEIALC